MTKYAEHGMFAFSFFPFTCLGYLDITLDSFSQRLFPIIKSAKKGESKIQDDKTLFSFNPNILSEVFSFQSI